MCYTITEKWKQTRIYSRNDSMYINLMPKFTTHFINEQVDPSPTRNVKIRPVAACWNCIHITYKCWSIVQNYYQFKKQTPKIHKTGTCNQQKLYIHKMLVIGPCKSCLSYLLMTLTFDRRYYWQTRTLLGRLIKVSKLQVDFLFINMIHIYRKLSKPPRACLE